MTEPTLWDQVAAVVREHAKKIEYDRRISIDLGSTVIFRSSPQGEVRMLMYRYAIQVESPAHALEILRALRLAKETK